MSSGPTAGQRGPALTAPPLLFFCGQEQYVFIHQCVLLMWQKKQQQQSITSDVIYENAGNT